MGPFYSYDRNEQDLAKQWSIQSITRFISKSKHPSDYNYRIMLNWWRKIRASKAMHYLRHFYPHSDTSATSLKTSDRIESALARIETAISIINTTRITVCPPVAKSASRSMETGRCEIWSSTAGCTSKSSILPPKLKRRSCKLVSMQLPRRETAIWASVVMGPKIDYADEWISQAEGRTAAAEHGPEVAGVIAVKAELTQHNIQAGKMIVLLLIGQTQCYLTYKM